MIKLLGAVFIIFAATMLGFYQSLQFGLRHRQIRQSIQLFERLETEIRYGLTPLPEALCSAAKAVSGPIAALIEYAADGLAAGKGESVNEIWQLAVDRYWGQTAMKQAERDIFLQLGGSLGLSGRDDQTKHIRLAVSHLQAEETSAAEDKRRYANMWRSLGLLSGVLIVILMY